ncbi:MAG: regulatory protein RecX [Bacteroidota bacterium]
MSSELTIKEAKERAGRFCAFRERSPKEVFEKVKSWGISTLESEKMVADLVALNYVNEQRFANAFCHDKFEFNSWGKQKIRLAIYAHNIPSDVVDLALERIGVKYEERLRELAKRKWTKLSSEETRKRKQKTANYLANKGFEAGLIWKTIALLDKSQ